MNNRDFGFVALGRFLAVERYRETHLSAPMSRLPGPSLDQTGGHADKSASRSGYPGAGSATARIGTK